MFLGIVFKNLLLFCLLLKSACILLFYKLVRINRDFLFLIFTFNKSTAVFYGLYSYRS